MLHPWAYDLDQVDFKYIVNNDLTARICHALPYESARAFWLSYFKCQSACPADDFFAAIREVCQINRMPELYEKFLPEFEAHAVKCDFVFSLEHHYELICRMV